MLDAWRLEPVRQVEPTALGTMNETFVVTTASRRLVLRRHRRRDRPAVEREHEVIGHARRRGVPSPAALLAPGGTPLVEHAGRLHSLFAYAPGHQVTRDRLTAGHARSMGEMLARLHVALADYPFRPPAPPDLPTRAETLLRLRDLVAEIERWVPSGEQEEWALHRLRTRERWLRSDDVPAPPPPSGSVQMIHGDYQESNLFFAEGAVVAVIDWDKTEPAAPADEIVRAMYLALHLDGPRCDAFLAGYRTVRDMPTASLDAAAAGYGFHQAHSLWLYETIYLHREARARRFLSPGHFVPFAEKWTTARMRFA